MMNCEWIRQNLSAYLDGELDLQQISDIERHIAACAGCAAAHRSMKQAWDALDSWEDVSPPERLRSNILRHVRFSGLKRWSVMISAAAMVIVAISVVLFYGTGEKEKAAMQMVRSQSVNAVPEKDLPDVEKEEIIANLDLLQEKEFYDSVEIMKKIDYLPLISEEVNDHDQKSILEVVIT